MPEKSRQIGIRISGEIKNWLESKTTDGHFSITSLVQDALERSFTHDRIFKFLKESADDYGEIEGMLYSKEGMELFEQQFDLSGGDKLFPSLWGQFRWALHKPTDTLFVLLQYIGRSESREERLEVEADRLFTQWLAKSRLGKGDLFLETMVLGRKYILVDLNQAKFPPNNLQDDIAKKETEAHAAMLARLLMREKKNG